MTDTLDPIQVRDAQIMTLGDYIQRYGEMPGVVLNQKSQEDMKAFRSSLSSGGLRVPGSCCGTTQA